MLVIANLFVCLNDALLFVQSCLSSLTDDQFTEFRPEVIRYFLILDAGNDQGPGDVFLLHRYQFNDSHIPTLKGILRTTS